MKFRLLGAELLYGQGDGQTDKHSEGSGRFLQFCEGAQKF